MTLQTTEKITETSRLLHLRVWGPMVFLALLCVAQYSHAKTPVTTLEVVSTTGYTVTRTYAGTLVPSRRAPLGFRHPGEIAQVHVDIGEFVTAGELLAELDTDVLEAGVQQARAELEHAVAERRATHAGVKLAQATEQRFRKLMNNGHASAQQYDEYALELEAKQAGLGVAQANVSRARAGLKRAEVELADGRIYAPFAGVVQTRHVDEGAQVTPGQAVLEILEMESPEVRIGVPEDLAPRLSAASAHQFRWRTQPLTGTLKAVLPEVDPVTRTVTAVFTLNTTQVPHGSLVELTMESTVPAPGFWVPMTSLSESERGLWSVYVLGVDDIVERRLVEVLHTEAKRVYVRGTLRDGDLVVSTGVQRIVPGQSVVADQIVAPKKNVALAKTVTPQA
jgi:RND family efflux transporter MFP subunit